LSGINSGQGGSVANCAAVLNIGTGFGIQNDCTITHCTADNNHAGGITASGGGCTITYCSVGSTTGNGITIGNSCTVTNCSAFSSSGSGISAGTGSTIAECTLRQNALDGIVCANQCVIRGNTCMDSGLSGDGAGIHATGADNRIEGNNCTLADRGIGVDLAGNIIIKNTCSGNTIDWVLVANNVFGPIIDRRAPASAAVSGFAAASSLGSTDANANFSY
jgi:parallel beta-helix repeat protein